MKNVIILLNFVLISLILTGCSSLDLEFNNAKYIGNFIALPDNDKIEIRFSLFSSLDEDKKYTSMNGLAHVRIINEEGTIIYQNEIDIQKDNFNWYTIPLIGEEFLAHTFDIPLTKIKKANSNSGTVYLKFSSSSGGFEEIETPIIWGLPTFSEEELEAINEKSFSQNAINLNQKKIVGNLEVKIRRAGFYLQKSLWLEEKEYFRIDMEITNIGGVKEDFFPDFALLDNKGNQYDVGYEGTLGMYLQIYPGVKKTGSLLFQDIPSNINDFRLMLESGYDENLNSKVYQYNLRFE